ncbi:MAG: hypothetical protein AMJ81_08065 [Phycisphaerae bacterium SM23_33]|nr:MAG: hypothetical protein AMJ81_08065 [Phycisphaerae bacterium SM23_33]
MKHSITVGGEERVIDIRAMDEDFIVFRKMYDPPLTAQNIRTFGPHDDVAQLEVIEEFFRKQIRALGSCMILAWEGDGVIGKMHFTTREMHEALGGPERWNSSSCYCVDHAGFAPAIKNLSDAELTSLLSSPSRTLCVLCFNVGHSDERYHGQGIAKAMVRYLKSWARERGWRRIEARSCPDITPTNVIGDWMLRRSPLERLGFYVLKEMPAFPKEAQARLKVIEELAAGKKELPAWAAWYGRNFSRLHADPGWRSEYDKDYLMACDL